LHLLLFISTSQKMVWRKYVQPV